MEYSRYRRYYQSLEPLLTKPKPRAYTTTVFSFLAISLFGWYGIKPTIQTILFLRREIADNIVVNQQMEDKISSLIEAQASYQEVTPNLPLLSEAVTANPDILPLVFQLRALASSVGASVSAVTVPATPLLGNEATPSGLKNPNKSPDVTFTVAVNGQYPNIKAFLEGVLDMRRVLTVSNVTISPLKDETTTGLTKVLRMVMKITTYYAPDAKSPGVQ